MASGGGTDCETSQMNELARKIENLSNTQRDQANVIRMLKQEVHNLKGENTALKNQAKHKKAATESRKEETSMTRELPKYCRLVNSGGEFIEIVKKFGHFAIRTASGEIHEYIIVGPDSPNEEKIEFCSLFKKQNGTNDAKNISMQEIAQAIADENLFIIENPKYPKTKQEKEGVVKRFWKELFKRASEFASKPAELISWLLTGLPNALKSLFKQGWALLTDLKEYFDEFTFRFVLRAGGCLLSSMQDSLFVQAASSAVVNSVKHTGWLPISSQEIPVNCYTKTICKNTSKGSLKKSAFSNLIMTGTIEGVCFVYDIYKLDKQKKQGSISDAQYRRQIKTNFGGAVGATVGSVGAGLVGQTLCPIPFLGSVVGSMAGNYGGRWLSSSVVDAIIEKRR